MINFSNKYNVLSIGLVALLATGFTTTIVAAQQQAFATKSSSTVILNANTCKSLLNGSWRQLTCIPYTSTIPSGTTLVIPRGVTLELQSLLANHGTIQNFGTIINSIPVNSDMYNYGIINNYAGATIVNDNNFLFNYGTINNYGTIDNNGFAGRELENYGTINNQGTINNSGVIDLYCGSTFTGNPINNQGGGLVRVYTC